MIIKMGINVRDHPRGIPHSAGRVIWKFFRGCKMWLMAVLYKHQASEHWKEIILEKINKYSSTSIFEGIGQVTCKLCILKSSQSKMY